MKSVHPSVPEQSPMQESRLQDSGSYSGYSTDIETDLSTISLTRIVLRRHCPSARHSAPIPCLADARTKVAWSNVKVDLILTAKLYQKYCLCY